MEVLYFRKDPDMIVPYQEVLHGALHFDSLKYSLASGLYGWSSWENVAGKIHGYNRIGYQEWSLGFLF